MRRYASLCNVCCIYSRLESGVYLTSKPFYLPSMLMRVGLISKVAPVRCVRDWWRDERRVEGVVEASG